MYFFILAHYTLKKLYFYSFWNLFGFKVKNTTIFHQMGSQLSQYHLLTFVA